MRFLPLLPLLALLGAPGAALSQQTLVRTDGSQLHGQVQRVALDRIELLVTSGLRKGPSSVPCHEVLCVVDGALTRTGEGGDIITVGEYGSFELELEWQVAPGGNSGVMYQASWPVRGSGRRVQNRSESIRSVTRKRVLIHCSTGDAPTS